MASQVIDHGRQAPTLEAYQVHVGSMRASSRGWLKLASKDPRQHPLIDPNYLDSEQDRWAVLYLYREGGCSYSFLFVKKSSVSFALGTRCGSV